MALTLADCDRIIAAVERANVHLIVGHTHAFDPAVRAMRGLIASGELGALGMVASWNYTNFLYRPRRPEELDTSKGGGILFNQVPHQIDVARLIGGGLVRSVRAHAGRLDPARPTEGHAIAFLAFADGVFVYGDEGKREIALPDGGRYSGRLNVLDDMLAAIATGRAPVHDGRWGKATLEVALAIQQSARERREVEMLHQVAVPQT